jgi:predicted MFS family arabinose efflux permease
MLMLEGMSDIAVDPDQRSRAAAARVVGLRRVLPLSAGMFVLGLDAYVLSGVLGNISGDLHVTVGAAGQMVTAFTLSYALLSPVLATVSGTWPPRLVLLAPWACSPPSTW